MYEYIHIYIYIYIYVCVRLEKITSATSETSISRHNGDLIEDLPETHSNNDNTLSY